ncbi:hypothetical protein Tco_0163986 [Tanacetum coccineum]
MVILFVNTLMHNTMAEQNVPAQSPTRTDEHILPRYAWLQIGKSNLLFDAQTIQKNPIFQISVDILHNTNFFRAFSASASVPTIYIQQFWNTMRYDEKTGVYSCQVDEQWFNLSADLLRKALDITPVDPAHPFELPPTGDTVIDFVNQCLTGNTSGSDKPRHPVLQMLWGIVIKTNIDHAELLWEEFTQGIQTFFSHKASHKASLKDPNKKAVPLLIPYGWFTKMIIYYLGSTSNVHRRPESPRHLPGDDFLLGNLKFIPKGETDDVFDGNSQTLNTEAIQQSSYYLKILEYGCKITKKTPQDSSIRERVAEEIQRLPDVEGKGKAIVTEEQAAHSLIDLSKKKKSGTEATAPKVDKEQGEGASTTVTSGIGISVRNENQAGSNPGQGHKALAGSNLKPMQEDSDPGKEHVALVGPNPEHMDEDFYATAYPKVHENLKLRTDKHVIGTDN